MRTWRALPSVVALAMACGPRWTLEDRTTPEDLTVPPRASHSQTLTIEASHPIATVRTVAEGISVKSGKLRVEHVDTREGCSISRDFEGREGNWNVVPATNNVSLTADRLELSAQCSATQHRTDVTIAFTNPGDAPIAFRWHVVAIANGDGSETAPDDAFVRIRDR